MSKPRLTMVKEPQGRWWRLMVAVVIVLLALPVEVMAGMDQAKPGESGGLRGAVDPHAGLANPHGGMGDGGMGQAGFSPEKMIADFYAKQDRTKFERTIALDGFRLLAIQHNDQMKIIDSWARQSLSKIRNRQTIDGKDPVLVALDMALRPEAWGDKRVIYVQAFPIREQLTQFAEGKTDDERKAEAQRIMTTGLVSRDFLLQQPVLELLEQMQRDTRQAGAVGKVYTSLQTMLQMEDGLHFLPPPPGGGTAQPWHGPFDVVREMMLAQQAAATQGATTQAAPAAVAGGPYSPEMSLKIALAYKQMSLGWQENDAEMANMGLSAFIGLAQGMDPARYPTEGRRETELWYNRSFNGTLVAFVYFLAMTLFLLVAVGVTPRQSKVEKTALVTFAIAVALHVTAMGIRWWLAERIPIKNQFESVLGSACIGCVIGLLLESWKKNGIFGVAFSFVGFLAMTACFAAPYVFGTDLGAAIGKVAGILDDYWLYIHVNIVIASYALISASFFIAVIYLGLRQWYWVNPIEAEADGDQFSVPGDDAGGGTAVAAAPVATRSSIETERAATLETLDQANMVVMQMAMWFLGIGIICGAVWADHSWGRPWGWDPKETFALVTWIVYLIIVHVRFVTKSRADWSAWLAVAGFGIMMFNWVGVNFFLQGLHSYA